MQAGRRYTFLQTLNWTKRYILVFVVFDTIPVVLYRVFGLEWMSLPWQPISLVGIAVAFYLGFKNNASYDRLWEARKIWGGIVNASRSFTVMARDFVSNDAAEAPRSGDELTRMTKQLVHRHIGWLYGLTFQLRKPMKWEHHQQRDRWFREHLSSVHSEDNFFKLKEYLSQEDYEYVMSKGNHASQLLSLQSKHLMQLRQAGSIEHFRHLEMQALITEFYTLQGKSERIKNFPFPRQYAAVNFFFVVLFIALLPFGMINVFSRAPEAYWIWLSIPCSVIGSWVFWMMEVIGDYSENPFEGLSNDVPISTIARSIEIDIRQMLDETDLPKPLEPMGDFYVLM